MGQESEGRSSSQRPPRNWDPQSNGSPRPKPCRQPGEWAWKRILHELRVEMLQSWYIPGLQFQRLSESEDSAKMPGFLTTDIITALFEAATSWGNLLSHSNRWGIHTPTQPSCPCGSGCWHLGFGCISYPFYSSWPVGNCGSLFYFLEFVVST